MPLLYDSLLAEYKNKKYIIINKHDKIDEKFYSDYLSIILKVRAMENYCAVILESEDINMCYQTSFTRAVQVIREENNNFGMDLSRTGGPEVIWKNKDGMQKKWRSNYENLLKFMVEKTD